MKFPEIDYLIGLKTPIKNEEEGFVRLFEEDCTPNPRDFQIGSYQPVSAWRRHADAAWRCPISHGTWAK
jgi:hypothetical protein